MRNRTLAPLLVLLAAAPAAAQTNPPARAPAQPTPAQAPPTPADAKAFVDGVSVDLKRLWVRSQTADWIKSTYITDDTERNSAALSEDVMAFLSKAIADAVRFDRAGGDYDTRRQLHLLKIATSLPAPNDPERRRELAEIAAKLEGLYGKGKGCGTPVPGKPAPKCKGLQDLEEIMAKSRSYPELLDAWVGWHTISREMRPLYARLVTRGNEGAREIGYFDLGGL